MMTPSARMRPGLPKAQTAPMLVRTARGLNGSDIITDAEGPARMSD